MSTQPEQFDEDEGGNVYPFPGQTDDDEDGAGEEIAEVVGETIDDVEEDEAPSTEIVVRAPGRVAERLGTVADRPLIMPVGHMVERGKWWGRALWRSALWGLTHLHVLAMAELRPIARGLGVSWGAWREWVTEAEIASAMHTVDNKTPLGREILAARSRHRKLSFFFMLLIIFGALAVCFFSDWRWLVVGGILGVGVLDAVGRAHPNPDAPPPPVKRTMLSEGAPLGSLTTTIIERLQEEGIRAEAAGRMTVHEGGEYRLEIGHEDAIEPKHLRSLERHIGAIPKSLRLLESTISGASQLRMPTRDHLASVPPRVFVPTGSRTVADPAPLWKRSDGADSSPILAAVHVDLVGTTGAGKSEALQEVISFFGECADVYPVFGDLTVGPLGALNKRVLRMRAFNADDLNDLLDWAQSKVDERHTILHELAESDDDDAPIEWDLSWGPQIVVIIDEYSFVAVIDELHEKVEAIMRVGRKVKVCVVRASQRSGNKDLGSTVAQALVGLKILMACTERDTTTMLSTEHRDKGWSPHLFRPAVKGDPRDAGKCYVWGPGHRDPEIHRFHRPQEPGETKRRDRQRNTDGLPDLDGATPEPMVIEALVLSDVQRAVVEIFENSGEAWMTTEAIVEALAARKITIAAGPLGVELGKAGSRRKLDPASPLRRGYAISDVQAAWEAEHRREQ